ncbi:MAG TPA: hypothetical protein DEV87_05830 [Clostridiales bacterium]|nr:hypothetical protein [Clostridiales bacterium]
MCNQVYFFISLLLKANGKDFSIGGVQTYCFELSKLFMKNQMAVTVYQFAEKDFDIFYEGIHVIGKKVPINNYNKAKKMLYKKFLEEAKPDKINDILLFATDYMIVKNDFVKSIAIQHGVAWDITSYKKEADLSNIFKIIYNSIGSIKKYLRFKKVNNIVAVDYNFLNWYRTQVKNINNKIVVIPNFVDRVKYRESINSNVVKIIFARRFVPYRGTRLFVNVIGKLLQAYDNIQITIAGEGPDEEYIKENIGENKNVFITRFSPDESFNVHLQHDIAVIPTLGSEGTSLSLLEAMGAGCAVVCTNVGGMTNIVLDRFNGIMIAPTEEELVNALKELIDDRELRNALSQRAVETVQSSFNKKRWENEWMKIVAK